MTFDIVIALSIFFIGLPLAILALSGIFSGICAALCAASDAVRAFVISAVLVVFFLGIVTLCFGFSWIR